MGSDNTQSTKLNRLASFSAFDKIVLVVVIILLFAIGTVILLGDRVGVTLVKVAPLGTARSTSQIIMQFSETMKRDSLPARLRVVQVKPGGKPDEFNESEVLATVSGDIKWNGTTLNFHPSAALLPGADYKVLLAPGATSDNGRRVLAEYRFGFTVSRPRVAYLAPASGSPLNVWLTDPANPKTARQVTFSLSGIFGFDASPDGTQIAFAEKKNDTGTADIKLLNLETGAIQQLTNCADADCTNPVWRPDGQMIGYERTENNKGINQAGFGATRIWLIDLATTPATTRPMFSDSQTLGYGLQWSADGNRVTVYDANSQGIRFHDFAKDTNIVIPSRYGAAGTLSPDGTRIVYPEVVLDQGQARSYLQFVNLQTQEIKKLSHPEDPIDDDTAAWSPDGKRLVIERRYGDSRNTRGRQTYLLNPDDGTVEPLIVDPRYNNGIFFWDPTGAQLLVQRFPELTADNELNNKGTPEIWTYDMATKALTQVAADAFFPRWVP
jgi:WD40 repeat protein